MKHRFVFVMGGVMSGVGKGTSVGSLGVTLQARGLKVSAMKIDPYVNVDAGTMNPLEHGEVFVTADGDETDQDMGNYERFLGSPLSRRHYMTTGRIYQAVIARERAGEYRGKCVEVVPSVPHEVISRIEAVAKHDKADIVLIEIGGTVGEYENILFLEAVRMMAQKYPGCVKTILVSYLPVPPSLGEMKTKPTQHAVRELQRTGIIPDFLLCRSEHPLDEVRKEKLERGCGVPRRHIVTAPNVRTIYEVPLMFEEQGFPDALLAAFGMKRRKVNLRSWKKMVSSSIPSSREVRIGILGKYFSTGDFVLSDVYLSVIEALKHASWSEGCTPVLTWLNAEEYEKNPQKVKDLSAFDGILVPGGFGTRGVEGKIRAITYVREQNIPYFGICYGMQCAVIEFARNVAKLERAHTTEVDVKTPHPVVHMLEVQAQKKKQGEGIGGTLRLGEYPCVLRRGTRAYEAYGGERVFERHRHRYEVNGAYRERIEKAGGIFSGYSPDGLLAEIFELPMHPYFVGVQFHPEFLSRPQSPHPLFTRFIQAARTRSTS